MMVTLHYGETNMDNTTAKYDLNRLAASFQPRMWFPHGFDSEIRSKIMWVYRPSDESIGEDGNWQVGFFYPTGEFFTESTYDDKDKAAARVNYLNGGGTT